MQSGRNEVDSSNPSGTKPAYNAMTAATAARTPIAGLKPVGAAAPVNGAGELVAETAPVPVAVVEVPVPTGTDAALVAVVVGDTGAEPVAELVAGALEAGALEAGALEEGALEEGAELAALELVLPPVPAKALIPTWMAVVIPPASWAAMG